MAEKEFYIIFRLRRVYDGDNIHNPTETTQKAWEHFKLVASEMVKVCDAHDFYFEDWSWEMCKGPIELIKEMFENG